MSCVDFLILLVERIQGYFTHRFDSDKLNQLVRVVIRTPQKTRFSGMFFFLLSCPLPESCRFHWVLKPILRFNGVVRRVQGFHNKSKDSKSQGEQSEFNMLFVSRFQDCLKKQRWTKYFCKNNGRIKTCANGLWYSKYAGDFPFQKIARWWFQTLFVFIPTWERFPF